MSDKSASGEGHSPVYWRRRIFALSWLSYFSYYFTRKNYSVVKSSLGLSPSSLALIDTIYTAGYAAGQFINGVLADVIGPRRILSVGMLISAGLAMVFGLSDTLPVFVVAYGLNGLAQSSGWPGNGRAMASWFSTADRGVVMGWWGTCYQVGGLAATTLATFLMGHWGWRAGYIGPALWTLVVAIAIALWMRDRPSDVGYDDVDVDRSIDPEERRRLRRAARLAVLKNPKTWFFGANYFCMKLMRYSLLFWLPFYLEKGLGYGRTTAGYMSTSFEIGGVIGVILCGQIADKLVGRRRVAVAIVATTALAAALGLYAQVGDQGMFVNFIAMMLVGALLFGPDSLISGVVSQDLGGPHAAALACGMINGLGSLGAILQGYLTSYVSTTYGWDTLFIVFQLLAVAGAVALLPYVWSRPSSAGAATVDDAA